ncbi:MAG: hypothetical protein ACE5GK_10575 [Nitrospiria bacterium]
MKMKISIFKWNRSHQAWPNPSQIAMVALFAAFIFLSSFSEAMAEVSLLIDDTGQLTGATGVVVGADTFDVSFLDGLCMDLFSGCDDPGNFTFTTFEGAKLAAAALEATVFLDSEKGFFDSIPSKVRGCSGNITPCSIITPFGFSKDSPGEIRDVSFVNVPQRMEPGPVTGASDLVAEGRTKDKKTEPVIGVWAVWSSPSPKP